MRDDVALDRLGHHHLAHQRLFRLDLLGRASGFENRLHLVGGCAGGAGENLAQFVGLGRTHHDLEQKAIHLRLGQRIGALELDRILRRQHEERRVERIGGAEDRDLPLLHRLEHGGLGLGRGAVDFVAEHDVGENRAGLEMTELAPAVALGQHLGADDIRGHQVGRELDPLEAQAEGLAGGLDHQGFAEAGDAFDQDVAARRTARSGFCG